MNKKSKSGKTPLTCAVTHGKVDIVRYLIEKGADVSEVPINPEPGQDYPSHDCLAILLEAGKEVKDMKGINKITNEVAQAGSLDLLRLLTNSGANLNGYWLLRTPVMSASISGKLECLEFLLENGGDLSLFTGWVHDSMYDDLPPSVVDQIQNKFCLRSMVGQLPILLREKDNSSVFVCCSRKARMSTRALLMA